MTIHDDLREVMGLLGKATPGILEALHPWTACGAEWHDIRSDDDGVIVAQCQYGDDCNALVAAVNFLRQHGPALLARQEGEDAERYRWLKANFQADYCRSTSDYWRITGEHETPQELHIGNGELTLDYLVDAARSGGGGG